jgi:CO/xanthine dehydrogenase Mo-binding subunit
MKPEAPQVHDGKPNLIYHYKCRRGDVAQGFSDSAVVIERHYVSPFVDHVFLQPESGLAYVEDDKVFIIASSQYPHFDQYEIAESIGWPNERVVILNPAVGGAFGGREDITMQVHLALAAIALDRPVKTTFSREESFYAHSKRHPVYMRLKVGADKEGKLLALEAELHGDTGAYASWAINVMRKAGVHITGPYEIPNVYVDSYSVYTNNPYAGAMRGFGATQVPIAYEQHMDILAEALGLTPFEIRMKNLFRKGSVTANGQVLTESVPLETCLLTLERAMNGVTEVESHA